MEKELMTKLALDRILSGVNNQGGEPVLVASIIEAYALYRLYKDHLGSAQKRRDLIDFVCEPSNNVLGNADEYFNLIMATLKMGDYFSAMKVCQRALTFYSRNCDLLAAGIKAASDGGNFALADQFLETAESIDKSRWSFHLFLYSVDYCKTRYKSDPCDQRMLDKGRLLANEYTKIFPYDEHGYNQLVEFLLLENKREEALALLEHYIFEPIDGEAEDSSLITAQCCTTMLHLLKDSHNYDLIIRAAKRGIRNYKTEQEHASLGYFAYRWALALDAICADKGYDNEGHIENALRKYQAAYNIANDSDFSSVIEQNYSFLRSFVLGSREHDPGPLVKQSLYIDGTVDTTE